MITNLSAFEEVPVDKLRMPRGFKEALNSALQKMDGHYKDMQVSHVFLFGSVARGTALYGSDIDLLLLTEGASERDVRIKSIAYDIDDDTAYVPIQTTVRKTSRFLTEDTDVCGFHKQILPDLILLRRYACD